MEHALFEVTKKQVAACRMLVEAAQALCDEADEQRYGAVIVRDAVIRACMEALVTVKMAWNW